MAVQVGLIGEWALLTSRALESYVYLVCFYGTWVAVLWSSAMCGIDSVRGSEYIDANWFLIQNKIIPFTTQLELKINFVNNMNTCMGMGIFAAVWAVTPLAELWSCLGGTLHQLQTRFGILLPEFVVLAVLAALTTAHSVVAAQIAPWATQYGTQAVLWQASCALLVLLAMLEIIVAVACWGPTFLVHAWTSAVFVPLAFILTCTSSVTMSRAQEMLTFVSSHWENRLIYAVPPQYASLSPERYASAAYFPAMAAGVAGILLAAFLWFGAIMHARCAIIQLSVGIELKSLAMQPRPASRATSRAREPHSSMPGGHVLSPVDESAADDDTTGRRPLLASGSADTGALGNAVQSPGGIALQPQRSRGGLATYGTTTAAGSGEDGPSSQLSPPALALAVATAAKEVKDMEEYAALASAGLEAEGYGAGRSAKTAQNTRSRLFSMAPHLAADMDEVAIAKRVRTPTFRHLASAAVKDARSEWKASFVCIVSVFIASVFCIGGVIGGMVDLQVQGQCGVLAQKIVQTTYSITPIEGVDQYANVVIDNQWPRGSVEIIASHFILSTGSHSFTVEISSWAPTEDLVMSQSDMAAAVVFSNPKIPNDDDASGGFQNVMISLRPPSSAQRDCTMMRVKISTYWPTAFYVTTGNAFINFTGNVDEVLNDPPTSYTYPATTSSLYFSTGSGAAIINSANVQPPPLKPFIPNSAKSLLEVHSATGDVFLNGVFAPGITATSGGSVRCSLAVSTAIQKCLVAGSPTVCGRITLGATGTGTIGVSRIFSGYDVNITSEHGMIALDSATVAIGKTLRVYSDTGRIYMSNFLQGTGNETYVSSEGDISASVVFANRFMVQGRGPAKVSLTEIFLGSSNAGTLFSPAIKSNYSDPILWAHTERGDISVLGMSGSPLVPAVTGHIFMDIASQLGKIRVQVNGGGFNGNYSVLSRRGKGVVEISGKRAPLSGPLGVGGFATATLVSDAGDVQLSQLPSPI